MSFKGLLVVLIAACSVSMGEINLKVGDPESQVTATMGQPQGKATINGSTVYMYDGGNVIAKGGKVVSFPQDFEAVAQRKKAEKIKAVQFADAQKAKGFVLYGGGWVTLEQKSKLEAAEKEARQQALIAEEEARQQALIAEEEARQQAFLRGGMRWSNIIRSPEGSKKGFGEPAAVTLRGKFLGVKKGDTSFVKGTSYSAPSMLEIAQDDFIIKVDYRFLPCAERTEIESRGDSKTPVEVTGPLIAGSLAIGYWIQATSVSFYK